MHNYQKNEQTKINNQNNKEKYAKCVDKLNAQRYTTNITKNVLSFGNTSAGAERKAGMVQRELKFLIKRFY